MRFVETAFAFHGRITRAQWLFRLILLGIAAVAFGTLVDALLGEPGLAIFMAVLIWIAAAAAAQRLHDIGRSAWPLLTLAIPACGPLWLALQLLRRGVRGPNRFGDDPTARTV
jgi:uncharacterized membrane protein YhaH (DUF805 family)